MKSTIRVKHDFDLNEPYLQLRLDGFNEEDADLKDEHLKNFVETANNSLMFIYYGGSGEGLPQVRVLNRDKTPEELIQLVIHNFETFAHRFFQETELDNCDSFFNALKIKASLKSKIKRPDIHPGPTIVDTKENVISKGDEFKRAATPLMYYLSDNHHPHVYATVDSESAMLIEGLQTIRKSDSKRTRRDYFELDLTQEWRIKAFENTPKQHLHEVVDNLYEAMKYVTEWRDEKKY